MCRIRPFIIEILILHGKKTNVYGKKTNVYPTSFLFYHKKQFDLEEQTLSADDIEAALRQELQETEE